MSKLEFRLPCWLTTWIVKWLTGRRQRVILNAIPSQWKDVVAGIAQGSVLRPILFLIFVLDINEYLPKNVCHKKYADDIRANIVESCSPNLPQAVVDGIQRLCCENKMRLNAAKCKVIRLRPPIDHIVLFDESLEFVRSYKYLEIELNAQLNFTDQ